MKLTLQKSDTFGALASTLCMIHCLVTPLLFIAHACTKSCCAATPTWWRSLDYLFIIISFFAVHRSTQTTSKSFMKPALWLAWVALFLVIMNETFEILPLTENIKYVPALALVALHIYNLKFCQCKSENCCSNHG